VDCEVCGTAICESPNLEKDALLLKTTYQHWVERGIDQGQDRPGKETSLIGSMED
jgi:hypothetical protein